MKSLIIAILFLSIPTLLFCQKVGKVITKPAAGAGATLDRRDLVMNRITEDRANVLYKNTYHIWTDSQLIEVNELENSIYIGQIIDFVFRINNEDEAITKIYYQIDKLSTSDAELIFERVRMLDYIPTSDSVVGVKHFLDGNFFGVDKLTKGQLSRRNYNDLFEQEAIEFDSIKDLFTQLDREFLKEKSDKLFSELPSGTYTYISGSIVMKKK